MYCDVCRRKIGRKLKERLSWTAMDFIVVHDRIQDILMKIKDGRTNASRWLKPKEKDIREVLDKWEEIIGYAVPFIEGESYEV